MMVQVDTAKNPREEEELWESWLATHSLEARNRLFEHYFPWSRSVASSLYLKYRHDMVEWRDFVHSASIALIKAIEQYDPERNVNFEAFAYSRLKGEVIKSIRPYIKDKVRKSTNTQEWYSTERLILPEENDDSFKAIVDAAIGLAFGLFLELGVIENNQDCEAPHRLYENEDISATLAELAEELNENERFVIQGHYFQQLSFAEIAQLLGVSRARVSQIHVSAIGRLRELYENQR